MNTSSNQSSAPVSIDRVRVIQRSIRCLVLGAIGVVPFFGLATGHLALRVNREIARELGERWDFRLLHFYWALVMFIMAISIVIYWPLTALSGVVAMLGHLFMVKRVADHARSDIWNPARHLVYWGVALAYVGRALTLTVLFLVAALIADRLGR